MSVSKEGWVRFSIRQTDRGWAWSTRDYFDQPRSSGLATSRAIAAAMVLREIARLSEPPAELSSTPDRKAA